MPTSKTKKKPFKLADWWRRASDAKRKSYVERHPRGAYAQRFAKQIGLKYDKEAGIDQKALKKTKVSAKPRKVVTTIKGADLNASLEDKLDSTEHELDDLDDKVGEHEADKLHEEHNVEDKDEKDAVDEEPSTEGKLDPTGESTPKPTMTKQQHRKMARKFTKYAPSALKKLDTVVPKEEQKHAEAALEDLQKGQTLENMQPHKKKMLSKVAKNIGKILVTAAFVGAMFTPLAPAAMQIGAEYLAQRFGGSDKADTSESSDDWVALASRPATVSDMYHDMADWLMKQDIDALAEKLNDRV